MEPTELVVPRGADFAMEVASRHVDWYVQRGYEPLSTQVFRDAAALSDIVLDVGAHVGWFSLQAMAANPDARVVAVEASPDNHEVLVRNLHRVTGGGVQAIHAAMGSHTGTATLSITEASDNCSPYGHPGSDTQSRVEVPAIAGSPVPVHATDSLLVKLDVEGAEPAVLAGLADDLAKAASVRLLVELNPDCLALAGHESPDDLLQWLRQQGFTLFLLDDRNFRWRRVSPGDTAADLLGGEVYANLWAVRGTDAAAVVHVLHSSGAGGAERAHVERAAWLRRRGHLVHTVIPDSAYDPIQDLLRQQGIPYSTRSQEWWTPLLPDQDWGRGCHDLAGVMTDLAVVNPDIVVTETGVTPVGAIAAQMLGIPHVWVVQEFLDLDHELTGPVPVSELGGQIAGMSEFVVTCSRTVADHVFAHAGAADALVLPCIDGGELAIIERRSRPLGDPPTIGIFASLKPDRKGHSDLLHAVSILADEGHACRLEVYGSGPSTTADLLAELAESLGIAHLVRFAGETQDPVAAMRGLDVVAVPSWAEAFGRVPFEAAFAGVPVVYADVGGPAEYMTDGVTGVACRPRDPRDLAAALRRVFDDGELRGRLQHGARDAMARWLAEHDTRLEFEARILDLTRVGRAAQHDPIRDRMLNQAGRAYDDEARAAARRLAETEDTRDDLSRRVAELSESLAETHRQLWAAQHEGQRLAAELDACQHFSGERQQQLDAQAGLIRDLLDSPSWRLTAPLRRGSTLAKRLRGRPTPPR